MKSHLPEFFPGTVDDLAVLTADSQKFSDLLLHFERTLMSSDGNILGDLAWPVERLTELLGLLSNDGLSSRIRLCVIGSNRQPWESARELDALLMNGFSSMSSEMEISSYWAPFDSDVPVEKGLDSLRGFSSVNLMVEASQVGDVSELVALAADREWVSLAFDTLSANSPQVVAKFIVECNGLEVPYQLQNLRGNAFTGETIGILNVFAACSASFAEELSIRQTADILVDSRLRFNGSAQGMHVGEILLSRAAVLEAQTIFYGVGAADVSQFIDDLKRL